MTLPPTFVESLDYLDLRDVLAKVRSQERPQCALRMCLTNEVKPGDLFCYLWARFGPPNGIQNLLRSDDSDNLIHWEWTLKAERGLVTIQGMNFRTEIWITEHYEIQEDDKDALAEKFKADFRNYGPKMSYVRSCLEHWIEFVNPYQRIRRSVERLVEELDSLELNPDKDAPPDMSEYEDRDEAKKAWEERTARYSKGLGICFGIRAMLPVLGESFINVLLYLLLRPEIRSDDRLRESTIRQPIDVRIKSLPINCMGFAANIDYSHDACKQFHSLINERNDLLHGNVSIDRLRYNEVMFWGKVPVFESYRSMWQRSVGVEQGAVGLSGLRREIEIVDEFINYILGCLETDVKEQVETILGKYNLGLNKETERIGILFPDWLVDMYPVFGAQSEDGEE